MNRFIMRTEGDMLLVEDALTGMVLACAENERLSELLAGKEVPINAVYASMKTGRSRYVYLALVNRLRTKRRRYKKVFIKNNRYFQAFVDTLDVNKRIGGLIE